MWVPLDRTECRGKLLGRRDWLRRVAGGAVGMASGSATGWPAQVPNPKQGGDAGAPKEADLTAAQERLHQSKVGPLNTVRSPHYVATGDAAEAFMKLIVTDCEQLARDYESHFRSHGFQVQKPDQPLIVVIFRDDRSFGKFFRQPTLMEAAGIMRPGIYDRTTNLFHVFDWRNVPMASRASHRNMETLAHEGTHQLSFNTGLLNRAGDVPFAIVEGLGTYGEARKTTGPSEFGRKNLQRLDDLAHKQRQVPWIPLRELLSQDTVLRAGNAARVMLAYAQSWLLVHYLMTEPAMLPRFRDYLKTIAPRTKGDAQRLEDARTHLGDLDLLDRELRHYAVRLQMSLR